MIADETEIFPRLSEINKEVKEKLTNAGLIEKIKVGKNTDLKNNSAV